MTRSAGWRGAIRAAVLLLASAALVRPGSADAVGRNYQVRDDRMASDAIGEYRRFAQRSEWPAALRELQKVLDLPPKDAVVVSVERSSPQRYENAWYAAVRLFESLPPSGRAVWEESERRPAEALLARGLRLRREEDLTSAARRYPARDIRRRAHDALAHLALARGDFDRAARETESLLDVVEPEARPAVLARLAFARGQSGDAEGTSRVAALSRDYLAEVVPSPSGPVRLGDLLARMQESAAGSGRPFSSVRRFGSDRHGSGVSEAPPKAETPGWTTPTNFRPGEENEFGFGSTQPGWDAYRPVVPTIAQGAVFLSDGMRLRALEAGSGREIWSFATQQREPVWRDNPGSYLSVTVADGVAYAALATRADAPDIERRFFQRLIIYSMPHRALHAVDVRTGEILWSHDRERMAGRPDSDEMDRESVASAPLVVGDDLFVVTWAFNTRYEARLVCFDRRTGATKFRTSLVHGQQEMNLFGRPVKELVVPPLAELDGLVYASTGMGIAAAVDRVTGAVAWLTEYDTTEIPTTYAWYQTTDRAVTWHPSPISATRQAVVLAPLESPWLVALDPRTGAELWKRPWETPAGPTPWFLGVTEGRAYAVGAKLVSYDLSTGEPWASPEAGRLGGPGSRPGPALGAGLLTPEGVHVPTANGIVRLDTRTGATLGTVRLPSGSGEGRRNDRHEGNLVSADGALVVASTHAVDAYFRFEDLAERLRARLASTPDDPRLRLEAGDVYRSGGRLDEAVICYERGLVAASARGSRNGERTEGALRRALVDALLDRALLRRAATDGPGAWEDLRRAADTARERGDSVRALFAVADCAAETGRDEACDAALRRIESEFGDVQTIVEDGVRADAGALAALRLGRRRAARGDTAGAVAAWMKLLETRPDASLGDTNVVGAVRDELESLAKALDARAAAELEKMVALHARRAFETALEAKDVVSLHRIARTSPSDEVGAEAALAAARLHAAAARPREAAAVLEGQVLRTQPPGTLARSLWLLAAAYRSLEDVPRERSALRRIAQECAEAALDDGRRAGDAAREELQAERFRAAPAVLPDPRPPLAQLWENAGGSDEPTILLVQLQGSRPKSLEDTLLLLQDGVLRLVDGSSGRNRWAVPAGVEIRAAYGTTAGFVLTGEDAQIRPRMVRLDGVRGTDGVRTWSRRLPGRYIASAAALGVVYVLRQDTNERAERVMWITAVAGDSGDVLADRRLGERFQPIVTAAADAILLAELIPQGSTARRRLHTLDGATLAPRGLIEVEGHASPFALNPPGSALVVTTSRHDGVLAVDATTGALAWPVLQIRGRSVKNVLAVPGGVIVTDDGDNVRRIDAATGKEVWVRPLAGDSTLGYNGEAAEGDLVVATLVPAQGGAAATAVGIDAATGEVRWRTPLPIEGRALPRPEVLQNVVAYELNVRRSDGYDCRVVLLDRTTGTVTDTIRHPKFGASLQRAIFQGPYVILWAPPRADLAVYGAPRAK